MSFRFSDYCRLRLFAFFHARAGLGLAQWLILLLLGVLTLAPPSVAEPLDTVRLQLKWKHQFQFAGYYAAIEKGFYREAGLEVTLLEPRADQEPMDTVIRGDAEFGVGTSDLLLHWHQGEPLVVLAVIFQHSPLALVADRRQGIRHLHDLAGRTLMIEPHSAELLAYLQREGLPLDSLTLKPHEANVSALVEGRVAALSIYTTDELFMLKQEGLSYGLFEPRSAGIDFYGDNLFTTRDQLEQHPDRVRAFREASLRGWKYALKHPAEIAQLIFERYSQRHSLAHLLFEAQEMRRLMQPELIEVGYMYEGRWRHMADTYSELGILPKGIDLRGLMYQETAEAVDHRRMYGLLALSAAVVLILTLAGLYVLRLNRRLHASESLYRVAYTYSPQAFVIWNEEDQIVDWNAQAERLFGWRREQALGQHPLNLLVAKPDQPTVVHQLNRVRNGLPMTQGITRNLTADGRVLLCEWVISTILDAHSGRTLTLGLATDVTERAALQKRLEYMAHHDALTGLANRAQLFERFRYGLDIARRSHERLAFLFIDLDGFKQINDRFGHATGDELLKQIAGRLSQALRATDTVARLGGDEFGVILYPLEQRQDAGQVADKLQAIIGESCQINGHDCSVGASIGIAAFPQDGDNAETLVSHADDAMYEVKKQGKGGYRFYS